MPFTNMTRTRGEVSLKVRFLLLPLLLTGCAANGYHSVDRLRPNEILMPAAASAVSVPPQLAAPRAFATPPAIEPPSMTFDQAIRAFAAGVSVAAQARAQADAAALRAMPRTTNCQMIFGTLHCESQ